MKYIMNYKLAVSKVKQIHVNLRLKVCIRFKKIQQYFFVAKGGLEVIDWGDSNANKWKE